MALILVLPPRPYRPIQPLVGVRFTDAEARRPARGSRGACSRVPGFLPASSTGRKRFFRVDAGAAEPALYVKVFTLPPGAKRLRYFLRPSKARRERAIATRLARSASKSPRQSRSASGGGCGVLERSYSVIREIDARDLVRLLGDAALVGAGRRALLERFARSRGGCTTPASTRRTSRPTTSWRATRRQLRADRLRALSRAARGRSAARARRSSRSCTAAISACRAAIACASCAPTSATAAGAPNGARPGCASGPSSGASAATTPDTRRRRPSARDATTRARATPGSCARARPPRRSRSSSTSRPRAAAGCAHSSSNDSACRRCARCACAADASSCSIPARRCRAHPPIT